MQPGVDQIPHDRLFPQRAQGFQPVQPFDQHEALALALGLERLGQLKAQGILNEEELVEQKAKILG